MNDDIEKIVVDLINEPSATVEIFTDTIPVGTFQEELIGTIDGENKVFATTYNYRVGSTEVYINGLKQKIVDHYAESGDKEITFSDAPTAEGFEDILLITYITR